MLRGGDLDVALKSDSSEIPGMFHTAFVHLKDALHAPQVATNLVSLHAHRADGREYVNKGGVMSTFRVKRRFGVTKTPR